MSLFDTLIVQPIFNVIMLIYAVLPGHDFGISLIIFAVVVRLLLWPMARKQLHQTKLMRQIQPELVKIKARTKGNKQLEGQLVLELYREKGINIFSSLSILLVQMPIFIALFQVVTIITSQRDRLGAFIYDGFEKIPILHDIATTPADFRDSFLGIDLTQHAVTDHGVYVPLIIIALVSAALQYFQSKQLTPQVGSGKKLRDMMRDSASGKAVDQSEISAVMTRRMTTILPLIAFAVALYLPGALVLFYAASSGVAVWQQHRILGEDVEEMEKLADKKPGQRTTKASAKKSVTARERAKQAVPAQTIEPNSTAKPPSKHKKRR